MTARLIWGNIKSNKKRTLISILCISFLVMLIYFCINAYVSFQNMMLCNAYEAYGKYNIILHNIDNETLNWIEEKYADTTIIGCEKIIGREDVDKDNIITIIAPDQNSVDMNHYKLLKGNFPLKDNDIAISATAKINDSYIINLYEIGDTITLNGTEYNITGILDDYNYSTVATYKMAIVCNNNENCHNNVYMHIKNKSNYADIKNEIKSYLKLNDDMIGKSDKEDGFLNSYIMILNEDLNAVEIEGQGSLGDKNIGYMLIVFTIIILLTSLILGTHIFLSYISARGRQHGILKSIGFSDKYIFFIYYIECFLLVVISCAIGIVAGRIFIVFLFEMLQSLRITELPNFKPQFSAESLYLVIIINLVEFSIGLIPVIFHAINKSIMEIIYGRNAKFKNKAEARKNSRYITLKLFYRDNVPVETAGNYLSLILISITLLMTIQVNKYAESSFESNDEYDSQFEIMSDDISNMNNFTELIPETDYYDLIYTTTGQFYFDKSDINSKYSDTLAYDSDGSIYCSIIGMSKQQYNNKVELSKEITYEEFADSGKAIIIDNYLTENETILNKLTSGVKYAGRNDEFGVEFDAGEVCIFGRSKYKNWSHQNSIDIIVPENVFKEKFDYTTVLYKINAKKGHEIEMAEALNNYSYLLNYTFLDHSTKYITEQDNKSTVKACVYGILLFIVTINIFNIVYITALSLLRKRKNINILKIIGHSDSSIIIPCLINAVIISIISTIFASFADIVTVKKLLPDITKNIILNGITYNMVQVFVIVIIIHIISVTVVTIRMLKKKSFIT